MRFFGPAADAAGTRTAEVQGDTLGQVLTAMRSLYGAGFATVLDRSRVWLNGDDAEAHCRVGPDDEVAVLPPVSGG